MLHWLHHLFNPHCELCESKEMEGSYCVTCDVLKMELSSVKQERDRLLNRLLDGPEQKKVEIEEEGPLTPLNKSRHTPWPVLRQTMEAEDRNKARLLKQRQKEMDSNVIPPSTTDKPLTVEQMEKVIIEDTDLESEERRG